MRSESALVRFLQELFPAVPGEVGIGDDAAVVASGQGRLVMTVDAVVEGTHFRWDWSSPRDLAWKALTPNVMDMVAVNAIGRYVLMSVGTGKSTRWLRAFYREAAVAARYYGLRVVGGDLVRSEKSFVSVTITGRLRAGAPLLRGRVRIGEEIWLTGPLGEAEAGRRLLQAGSGGRCRTGFLRPKADIARLYRILDAASPTAAVDVSDGLLRDVQRLTGEGRAGALLDLSLVPCTPAVERAAKQLGVSASDLRSLSGEEPQLLFTLPRRKVGRRILRDLGAVPVGEVVRKGVWLRDPSSGKTKPVSAAGYDHLKR